MGLLNKSFRDIKKDFSTGQGWSNSLFKTTITQNDFQNLQKFNSAINNTNDGLTKSQRITRAWNANMTGCSIAAKRMGNDLVTGKKTIKDISAAMNNASTSTKALGVAMNVLANVGLMLAITAVTKVISELSQAQEKAVQMAKEATESYKDEISSISDYKTRLSELHKELNSGNLSYEETKTKRSELMSIQDELIKKFGTEKTAIEAVTEAIDGQVNSLDTLNEKSYRAWVAKADEQTFWNKLLPGGKSGLDQAVDYMESDQTISFSDMSNANSRVTGQYADLNATITDEIRAIQEEIDKTIQSKYNLEKQFATFKLTGAPDEIKSQLEAIRQDYIDLSKDAFLDNGISSEYWEAYRSEAIDSINEVINKLDDGLTKHQDTYKTYIEGMIKYDSEYSDEYATILQKRAELESAQNSGNKEEIQKARRSFMEAVSQGIEASGTNENIKKYFETLYPELQAEFASWNFEFSLNANTDGIKDIATQIGEKYTATNLLAMVNTEGVQEGEDSFNKLIDKAIEYGICTDNSAEEVQKLIDLLVELGIVQGEVSSEKLNKMTGSLDSLSSAIKSAQSAFELFNEVEKDFNSTGAISAENIQKILGKFPELEDELYEYIMGMRSGASVMDLLKTKSDDMATMSADAFRRMYLSSNSVSKDIKDDFESAFNTVILCSDEAEAAFLNAGLEWDNTQSVMANVNKLIIDANGQVCTTFAEQWNTACQNAGNSVQLFAKSFSALLMGDFYTPEKGYGVYRGDGQSGIYYKDITGETVNQTDVLAFQILQGRGWDTSYGITLEEGDVGYNEYRGAANQAYADAYSILNTQYDSSWENQAEFERRQKEFEERMKQYATTSDNKGSDKNEALDNYLKDAENRYKIHQDETKYIQELQWAHDNLTKDEKERLDIIGKINEAYRDLADNRIKDLEHQIDLKKELYGEDYDATAEWSEIQRIAHEEAERLRAMGYDNNSNEIQSLQKTWWDAENSKLEFYSRQHENIIRDIEHARDMALNADENADVTSYYRRLQEEYHKEAERLRLLDPEKYKEEIQEFQQLWWDAEKEILDHNKQVVEDFLNELQEAIDNSYDIRISRLNSQSSLLSSHFNIVNAIAEEQHNLNKELLEAQTIGAEMNEMERESLFTKEEHTRLSSKLSDIMLDVTDLQHDYQRDLETATKDTINEITNQYERQYELKMKEYEIVKAELALAKAQQVLENTKNEKSVRTWTGSGWSYAANIQDVIDAQEEVENAKYDLIKSKTEEVQQKAINVIDASADALETEKNKLATAIDSTEKGWTLA